MRRFMRLAALLMVLPLILLSPAKAQNITVNTAAPLGTVAHAEAFGVAFQSGSNAFGTMNTSNWQAAVAAVGGFYLYRFNPNTLGNTFSSSGTVNSVPSSISEIDSGLSALIAMHYTGRIIMGLGFQSPSWLATSNYSAWGQMALQVAKYAVGRGMPITYWEGFNEPDGNGVSDVDAANITLAIINAFNAAGAPYNTYVVTGPTDQNVPSARASYFSQFVSVMGSNLTASRTAFDFHFYACCNFGVTTGATNAQIALAADPTNGYGAQVNAARAYGAGIPVAITEYNMDGAPSTSDESQDYNGAVYNALAMLDAVKIGGLDMGAVWAGFEDFPIGSAGYPAGEVYGIINGPSTATAFAGGTVPAYGIYPVAWALGRLANKMPGTVVTTSTTLSSVYTMATATGTGAFKALALVNYGTSAQTANISFNNAPTAVDYFEVSQNYPAAPYLAGSGPRIVTGMTPSQLTSLTLPARSVVVLSASSGGSSCVASLNDTVVTTVGPAITDASCNVFSINSAGQVVINTFADTTTSTVVELAYVNSVLWQENSFGNWYSYLGTPGSYSAATTTSPLPTSFINVDPIGAQVAGISFLVTGQETGVAAVPTLQYQDNTGGWLALPTGSTVTLSTPATLNDTLNPIDVTDAGATGAVGAGGAWMDHYAFGGSEYTLSSNNEAECYVSASRTPGFTPFSLGSNIFAITADTAQATAFYPAHTPANTCGPSGASLPYNSGAITSATEPNGEPGPGLFSQLYGYFAMKAVLPAGTGLWPAFWMEPQDGVSNCEIDVMEALGSSLTTIYTTLHSSAGGEGTITVSDYSRNWHEYAVDWEANFITWYVDGVQVYQLPTTPECKTAHYLMANLAVGAAGSWPGPPVASTVFPATMRIEYIKAYASKPAGGSGTTALWSFTNPAMAVGLTNTVSVRDAGTTSILGSSNGFTVIGTEALNLAAISSQTVNTAFTVTGTILNAAVIPTLQYQDNGGAWVAVPTAGVTLTTFSFSNPGLALNAAATVAVRDANSTAVTASATFAVNAASVGGPVWDIANTSASVTLSNSSLTATSNSAVRGGSRGFTPQSTGSYCFQGVVNTMTANTAFGIGNAGFALAGTSALGANANSFGFSPASAPSSQVALYNGVQVLPSRLPEVTPGVGSMTDSSGNVWTIDTSDNMLQSGVAVPQGQGTSAVTVISNIIYAQDSASLSWYTYTVANTTFTASAAPTVPVDVSGDAVMECVNLTSQLAWVTTPAMRQVASAIWNSSLTASPATGVGGVSFSGLTCPCYVVFDTQDATSQVTLNETGGFLAGGGQTLPAGFLIWQTLPAVVHHPFLYNFGQNAPANDNAYYQPVNWGTR